MTETGFLSLLSFVRSEFALNPVGSPQRLGVLGVQSSYASGSGWLFSPLVVVVIAPWASPI